MTRIDDPVVRRTLVNEIAHLAHLWAAQADRERASGMHRRAAITEAKAMSMEQLARDIEDAV